MEEHIRAIINAIGEDPDREGLLKTPQRVSQALTFLTRGYEMDPAKVINDALFTEDYEEMIVQKDIDFFSLCEHHLLPFFGKAHVAYIPHHKIVGISKLARLVDVYARRLQVQERMTNQIATIIMEKLDALGVAVVIEAEHLCMRMRGVEKQNSYVITSSLLGAFRTTLEELKDADMLLHLVDAGAQDIDGRIAAVESVLKALDLETIPRIVVLNKCDRLSAHEAALLTQRYKAIGISAVQPDTLRPLIARIESLLASLPSTAPTGDEPPHLRRPALASR